MPKLCESTTKLLQKESSKILFILKKMYCYGQQPGSSGSHYSSLKPASAGVFPDEPEQTPTQSLRLHLDVTFPGSAP